MIAFSQEPGAFIVVPGPRFFERRREGGADSQRASQRPSRVGMLGVPPPQRPVGERGLPVSPRGPERLGAPEQKIRGLVAFREEEQVALGVLRRAQGPLLLPVYAYQLLVDERGFRSFFSFFGESFERAPGDGVFLRSNRRLRQKQERVVLERGNLPERILKRLDRRAVLFEFQVRMSQKKSASAAHFGFFPAKGANQLLVSLLRQEFFDPCGQGRTCGFFFERRFCRAR